MILLIIHLILKLWVEMEPLVISFRLDDNAANLRAMNDWVNSVEDPITGLRSLPADVEADIQVNLHNREGIASYSFYVSWLYSYCMW